MSLLKQRYRGGKTRNWYVQFRTHLGRPVRFPGFRDRASSEELERRLLRLVAIRASGAFLPPDMSRWLEGLGRARAERLVKLGLIDARQLASTKSVAAHLDDWHAAILARGTTEKHADLHVARARAVLVAGCSAISWSDVTPAMVVAHLARRRGEGLSGSTSNHMLGAVRSFARWLVAEGRTAESPLAHLTAVHAARTVLRRALTTAEARLLLQVTRGQPRRHGASGPERALIYRIAIETGLRAAELGSLAVASFDLDTLPPTVRISAESAKNRREATLPLRESLAEEIRAALAGKAPADRALAIPAPGRTAKMLRDDLAAAGILDVDASGRRIDFHALRHTCSTWLARAGVAPKTAQGLMRHSSPVLTLARYTAGSDLQEQARALEHLPDLGPTEEEEHRARGS